ncbi:MAG: hypothetical protein LUI87_03525, partial [Lachnospiraceae bacterium]|nr:hypothetical protein [Lachnospiraceae bacterium]
DYIRLYEKIYSCVENACSVYASDRFHKTSIHEVKKNIRYINKTLTLLKETSGNFWIKLVASTEILKARIVYDTIAKFDIYSYYNVTVFDDVSSAEHIIIERANSKGITTVTMEHGAFGGYNPKEATLDELGIEFRFSNAKYYLLWNLDEKEKAINSGLTEDKLKIVGIPAYIGVERNSLRNKQNLFGIILNGAMYETHNIPLIKMGNKIAKYLGYKYIVRYHPNYKGTEYFDQINYDYYAGNSEKSESILEYSKRVDFSIITCSAVFNELIYLNSTVYRYAYDPNDKFSDVKDNSFESFEDFKAMYPDDHGDALFNRFCTVRDVEKAYKDFYRGLL